MGNFRSSKLFKVGIIGVLFVFLIFINPYQFFDPFRQVMLGMLSPFQKVFYSTSLGMESVKDFLGSIGQLKKDNEQLLMDNQALTAQLGTLHDIEKENATLREQLDLIPRNQYDLVAASVISQDPNGLENWLEIDKGSNDGILSGMPVIVSKGIMIGRVQEVSANSCKITLLTNPKSTINVMDVESGAKGVVKGEYGLGIIFDMILQTDSIQVGNSVVTSGIGGDIPRGLFVGTVQEVHPSEDHLFQQAVVTAPVQVSKLQFVFVVKGAK